MKVGGGRTFEDNISSGVINISLNLSGNLVCVYYLTKYCKGLGPSNSSFDVNRFLFLSPSGVVTGYKGVRRGTCPSLTKWWKIKRYREEKKEEEWNLKRIFISYLKAWLSTPLNNHIRRPCFKTKSNLSSRIGAYPTFLHQYPLYGWANGTYTPLFAVSPRLDPTSSESGGGGGGPNSHDLETSIITQSSTPCEITEIADKLK